MLRVSREILEASFAHLRSCGAGSAECVVLWVGPQETPDLVDEVVHPTHTASAIGYDVDPGWIGNFWLDLANRGRTVRAQAHTHPGSAYHSSRDDDLPLIHMEGYISVVIPRFAMGSVGLDDVHVAMRKADGRWTSHAPNEILAVA